MADDIVGSARIRIDLDDSDVDRQARATARRLRDSFKGSGRAAADGFTRDASGRLRDSRGRFVAEGTQMGEALARGAGRGAALLSAALATATRGLGGLVAGAGAVTALSIALASTATTAVGLAAALAPAAGIIAALPAGVLLLQAAVGTLRLALLGVGEAFEAAVTGDSAEFAKTLDGLAPAARAVAVELRAARPAIDGLRQAVQGAFFAPFQGEITRLVDTLEGSLTAGMTGTAAEFGRLGVSLTRFASSASGVELVDRVFASLRGTLDSISSATVDRLLVAVGGFAASTLPAFNGLGDAIDAALVRLSAFLEEATIAGDGFVWVTDAVTVFRQLGSIVADTGGIIVGVFAAAESGGESALGAVTNLLQRVREFVESAEGQVALVETFRALAEVGSQFGVVLGALLVQLGRIAPTVADLSDSVGGGLADALDAVGSGLVALGPGVIATFEAVESAISGISDSDALASLAAGASDLLEALAPLIPAAADVGAALGELGPAASLLAAVLTPLVALVGGVASVFAALPGPLQAAGLALVALVAMRSKVAAFGDTLSQLPQRLSSQAVSTATRSMSVLRGGITGLLGVVGGPWGAAIAAGVTAISLFGQRQQEAAQKVTDLTATLDEQTGALTASTRQWVVNELHQRGTLELAKRMGIDTALVTQAVLGQEGAVKALNTALDANLQAARARADSQLPGALQGELANASSLRTAVGELSATYRQSTADAQLKIEASRQVAFSEQGAARAVRDATAAMKEQANELRAQVDPAFAFQLALQGVADKQTAYAKAVQEAGAGSREAKVAALELALQSAELQTAAAALGDTFTGRLTPQMRTTLQAAGLTKQQIAAVEKSLKDTKKAAQDYEGNYRANVEVRGTEAAQQRLRNLQAVLADVERSVTIGVVANVNLNSLPAFADGGIVRSPVVGLVGEAGPEVVIPLTRPARARQLAEESGLAGLLAGRPSSGGGGDGGGGGGGGDIYHTWNIYEVGDGEATARRVLNRLAFAGGL
ncbi:hypothetical protein ACFOWE_18295 [Planomonospora corallina]|uniref:Uncharacterized protein n=1 Tax=Planomonospora corallina TaxID=1806052 RepID=A0ABV8I8F3_9ACTN